MNSITIAEETLNDEESLARQYIKYLKDNDINNKCWDDFFDYIDIPARLRTDFLIAAILKQALELCKNDVF